MGEEAVLGIGSPITQCGSHLPQAVEPTSIPEVSKGEGIGKEELQQWFQRSINRVQRNDLC